VSADHFPSSAEAIRVQSPLAYQVTNPCIQRQAVPARDKHNRVIRVKEIRCVSLEFLSPQKNGTAYFKSTGLIAQRVSDD